MSGKREIFFLKMKVNNNTFIDWFLGQQQYAQRKLQEEKNWLKSFGGFFKVGNDYQFIHFLFILKFSPLRKA